MVTKKPTTRVQIMSQSDIMRTGQNYKINKKIWEAIEEKNKNNGLSDLISRIEALEAEEYDDSALKQAMGYDDIPENESLQSQIDDLLDEIGDSDTPDSIIARLDELDGGSQEEEQSQTVEAYFTIHTKDFDDPTSEAVANCYYAFVDTSGGYVETIYDGDTDNNGHFEILEMETRTYSWLYIEYPSKNPEAYYSKNPIVVESYDNAYFECELNLEDDFVDWNGHNAQWDII